MAAARAVEILRSSPIFATLPAEELAALARGAREHRVQAREYVFVEGETALWFCLVASGRVKIVRQTKAGREVVLELLGPGEVFGGVAVIEKRPYPASAQATEPSVIVKIPEPAIAAAVERHPSIVREMARLIGQRLRAAHTSVASLAVDPVETRLAATLLRLADPEGDAAARALAVPFHVTRQTLADMSGTTVETAIRVISRWQRERLVRDENGRLLVTDAAALRTRAAGSGD